MRVVVDLASGNKGLQVRRKTFGLQSGHKTGNVVSVRSDVACRSTRARAFGVSPPLGLFEVLLFGQPVLRVLNLHYANISNVSISDHFPCLPDHRVARVIVRKDKKRVRTFGRFDQFFSVAQRRSKRLVANDMDAAFQELAGRCIVDVVGRDD